MGEAARAEARKALDARGAGEGAGGDATGARAAGGPAALGAPPPRAVGRKLPAGRRPQVARKSQTGAAPLGAPPAAGRLLPPARYSD